MEVLFSDFLNLFLGGVKKLKIEVNSTGKVNLVSVWLLSSLSFNRFFFFLLLIFSFGPFNIDLLSGS